MKTPTHLLLGYGAARLGGLRGGEARLLIGGAILPDVPIAVCFPAIAIHTSVTAGAVDPGRIRSVMDGFYFSDSALSWLHNLLHAPVSLLLLFLIVGIVLPSRPALRRAVLIVLAGALSHALLDIVSHVDDGPLVFWPIEQTVRIRGLFSHWNPAYGGGWVTLAELAGSAAIGGWWLVRRFALSGSGDGNRADVSRSTG